MFSRLRSTPVRAVRYVKNHAHMDSIGELIKLSNADAAEEIYGSLTSETRIFSSKNSLRDFAFGLLKMENSRGLVLDFGVREGHSTLGIAKALRESARKVYGFDAFLGLRNPWSKVESFSSSMSLDGTPPKHLAEDPNIELIVGWVEDTLPAFLEAHSGPVFFANLDFDVFEPTKFALQRISPRLREGSLVLFDDMFGFPGWRNHSHRAMREVFGTGTSLEAIAFSPSAALYRYREAPG